MGVWNLGQLIINQFWMILRRFLYKTYKTSRLSTSKLLNFSTLKISKNTHIQYMNDGGGVGYALAHLRKRKRRIEENGKVCNFQPFTINFLLFATDVDVVVIFSCVRTPHFIFLIFAWTQKKGEGKIKYQRK